MNYPPYNTPLYRIQDNSIQTLIFKRVKNCRLHLEDESGMPLTIPTNAYSKLILSKRVLLAELEERLRKDLERVHNEIRAMQVEFNPIDAEQPVPVTTIGKPKRVYQYDLKTGAYIRSFPSARNASNFYGGDNTNVAKCCQGIQRIAYGFRWSYDKYEFLHKKL